MVPKHQRPRIVEHRSGGGATGEGDILVDSNGTCWRDCSLTGLPPRGTGDRQAVIDSNGIVWEKP